MNSFCYSMTNGIEPELYKNEAKEECVCDVIKGPARENPLRLPPYFVPFAIVLLPGFRPALSDFRDCL